MASLFSLRGLIGRQPILASQSTMARRLFSTTALSCDRMARRPVDTKQQRAMAGRGNRQAAKSEYYQRVKILKQNMFSPAPPPLRMARLRYLRHWTIHRAWQLFRRQHHEAMDKERHRMHAGMFNACEELRKTICPDGSGEGYLYRVAMEKKGVYGLHGVPIEYARFQTDAPAKVAWNHEWKR